jgi:hypothetical protein
MNNEHELKLEKTENGHIDQGTKSMECNKEEKFIHRKRKCNTSQVKFELICLENFRILKLIRIMKRKNQNYVIVTKILQKVKQSQIQKGKIKKVGQDM